MIKLCLHGMVRLAGPGGGRCISGHVETHYIIPDFPQACPATVRQGRPGFSLAGNGKEQAVFTTLTIESNNSNQLTIFVDKTIEYLT